MEEGALQLDETVFRAVQHFVHQFPAAVDVAGFETDASVGRYRSGVDVGGAAGRGQDGDVSFLGSEYFSFDPFPFPGRFSGRQFFFGRKERDDGSGGELLQAVFVEDGKREAYRLGAFQQEGALFSCIQDPGDLQGEGFILLERNIFGRCCSFRRDAVLDAGGGERIVDGQEPASRLGNAAGGRIGNQAVGTAGQLGREEERGGSAAVVQAGLDFQGRSFVGNQFHIGDGAAGRCFSLLIDTEQGAPDPFSGKIGVLVGGNIDPFHFLGLQEQAQEASQDDRYGLLHVSSVSHIHPRNPVFPGYLHRTGSPRSGPGPSPGRILLPG